MPYQLRKQTDFQIPSVRSVFSGTESIKVLGPKIWEQYYVHLGYVKRIFTDLV